MKKLITLAAAVVSAALFFGCSDSSDNNNAALLLAASSSSSGVSLPESVGENELAGKKFSVNSETVEFSESSYVTAMDYTSFKVYYKCSYTYNSNTKSLYSYALNTWVEGDIPQTDEKSLRYLTYSQFGYTDTTNETEVPSDVIARYKRYESLHAKKINRLAYNLSSDGSTLKLISDSRYPKDLTLKDIYSPAYADTLNIVNNSSTVYTLSYSSQYIWPERNPALMSSDLLTGHKVSSITSDRINLSALGIRFSSNVDFDYTSGDFYLAYDATSISNGVKYTIKNLLSDTTMGEITINYATSSNIPDMTSATTYTLVTE